MSSFNNQFQINICCYTIHELFWSTLRLPSARLALKFGLSGMPVEWSRSDQTVSLTAGLLCQQGHD